MRFNATTAWDCFDDCVFVAHRRGRLIDADFGEFLEDVIAQPKLCRVVVRASDGAPRADHRATLLRWYQEKSVRAAILTDSVLARGGVTALGWFGVAVRAFEPNELDRALDFVNLLPEYWSQARSVMHSVVARADGAVPSGPGLG